MRLYTEHNNTAVIHKNAPSHSYLSTISDWQHSMHAFGPPLRHEHVGRRGGLLSCSAPHPANWTSVSEHRTGQSEGRKQDRRPC